MLLNGPASSTRSRLLVRHQGKDVLLLETGLQSLQRTGSVARGERSRFKGSEGHQDVGTTSCLVVAPRSALQLWWLVYLECTRRRDVAFRDFNSILLLISITQPAF